MWFRLLAGTSAKPRRLRRMKKQSSWMTIAFDSWCLGVESSAVIALRMARLATGPASAAEARLMVSEKIEMLAVMQMQACSGKLGSTPERQARAIVAGYRRAVARNRRRLGGPRRRG